MEDAVKGFIERGADKYQSFVRVIDDFSIKHFKDTFEKVMSQEFFEIFSVEYLLWRVPEHSLKEPVPFARFVIGDCAWTVLTENDEWVVYPPFSTKKDVYILSVWDLEASLLNKIHSWHFRQENFKLLLADLKDRQD